MYRAVAGSPATTTGGARSGPGFRSSPAARCGSSRTTFSGSDDHAVGVYTMHLDLPDRTVSWRHVNVYRVRDGKIAEVWENPFEQDVFDELFS